MATEISVDNNKGVLNELDEELPPIHQGEFTYDPKPPSENWKQIVSNRQKKQKEIKEIFEKDAKRSKAWEEKMEREHREHLERVNKQPAPDRPVSWRYIPTKQKNKKTQTMKKRNNGKRLNKKMEKST